MISLSEAALQKHDLFCSMVGRFEAECRLLTGVFYEEQPKLSVVITTLCKMYDLPIEAIELIEVSNKIRSRIIHLGFKSIDQVIKQSRLPDLFKQYKLKQNMWEVDLSTEKITKSKSFKKEQVFGCIVDFYIFQDELQRTVLDIYYEVFNLLNAIPSFNKIAE